MPIINELRLDCALKQKRGLHIILASIIIWLAIAIIHFSSILILTKNLFTFVCAAVLLPLSYFISKLINVDFQNKNNPLTDLGILFSVNQVLYLLIADVYLSHYTRKNAYDISDYLWGTFTAVQLAV